MFTQVGMDVKYISVIKKIKSDANKNTTFNDFLISFEFASFVCSQYYNLAMLGIEDK